MSTRARVMAATASTRAGPEGEEAERWIASGDALRDRGEFGEAANHFRRASVLAPADPEPWTSLGMCLLLQQTPRNTSVWPRTPDPGAAATSANASAATGSLEAAAVASFDRAIAADPDDPDLRGYRRHALWCQRRTEGVATCGGTAAVVVPAASVDEAKRMLESEWSLEDWRCGQTWKAAGPRSPPPPPLLASSSSRRSTPTSTSTWPRRVQLAAATAGAAMDPDQPALLVGAYAGAAGWDYGRLTPEALMEAHPRLQLQLGGSDAAGGKVSVACATFVRYMREQEGPRGDDQPLAVFDFHTLHLGEGPDATDPVACAAGAALRSLYSTPDVAALDFRGGVLDRPANDR